MVRGGPAVRLIEHILINSISPACNRPHGYLTVLVMVARVCWAVWVRVLASLLLHDIYVCLYVLRVCVAPCESVCVRGVLAAGRETDR